MNKAQILEALEREDNSLSLTDTQRSGIADVICDLIIENELVADLAHARAQQQVENVKRHLRSSWTGRVRVLDVLAALDDV